MALFGRKKHKDLTDEELLALDEDQDVAVRPEPEEGEPGVDRPWVRAEDGPYDVSEWRDVDGRLDLGALRLPVAKGMQLRLDLEQGSGRVIGATLGFGASQAQVQVFAAPRTVGLWDELRQEIARGLVDAGGAAETVDGLLGKELRARMPGQAPDGRVAFQPARFLGVDGPRWFLRVVVNGAAATDDQQLRGILQVVRRIVVRRGDEPRPPREILTLTPPKGFEEALAKEAAARKAQAQQAQQAAVRRVAAKAPSLSSGDATAIAGIAPQAQGAEGRIPAPAPAPQPPASDAPKAPTNPDFT
ncbi:DUF3710 domain-containing protein [Ornithinimicrobium flavum]|uniref:DUF3710 domain-containing protein n=1 Tax=Ornithinimicrobium flavum TaxID=1288636 RepID=UPI0013054882|nr:DUF3710 domain-containing protein [Ornithinimicrobium flavum]